MGLVLFEAETVEEPLQLTSADGSGWALGARRPAKGSPLQASVVEPEAVGIPQEDLEFITTAVAEDEEASAEEIELEGVLHQGGEAVDGLAQVGTSTGEVDLGVLVRVQHDGLASAATTARKSSALKLGCTSMAAPAMRTVIPPRELGEGGLESCCT